MKIIPPNRGCHNFIIAITLLLLGPLCLNAQDCGTCPAVGLELEGCDTNNDNDASFDLDAIPQVDDNNSVEFYRICAAGVLTDKINGNTSNYFGNDQDVIYVLEEDGNTCVRVLAVLLDVHNLSVSIDPDGAVLCEGEDVNLSAQTSGVEMGETVTYSWSVPSGSTNPGNTASFNTDDDGFYGVTIMVEGCSSDQSDLVEVEETDLAVSITPTSGDVCPGQPVTLTANASGGEPNYSYSWILPNGQSNPGDSDEVMAEVSGNYSVIVTDDDGCSKLSGVVSLGGSSFTASIFPESGAICEGSTDIDLTAITDPASGNTYNWSTPSGSASTKIVTADEAGDYSVTVTRSGCSIELGPVTIIDQAVTITNVDPTDESCAGENDGTFEVTVSGGSGNYTYDLNPGPSQTGGNNFTFTNLSPGSYSVVVTDNAGGSCSDNSNSFGIDPGSVIDVSSPVATSPTCRNGDDGSIQVNVSNDEGTYTIEWEGPGNNDDSDSNESGSQYTIEDLEAGTYSITVTNTAGCSDEIASVTIINPPSVSFNAAQLSAACEGASNGSIRVSNISNGTSPYTIAWNGPGNNDDDQVTNSTTDDIEGLPEGSYTISLIDANGCIAASQQVTINTLPDVNVTIIGDDVFCAGDGSGSLQTSPGGFSNYQWSPGNSSSSSITVPNPNGSSVTYRVTVTDNAGCTGTDDIEVEGLDPISISLNSGASKTSVTCSNDCDGRIDINISGGTGSYTFSWDGPGSFSKTTADIDDLCDGEYSLNVVDSEGCTASFNQTITVPLPIEAAAVPTEVTCNGDNDGVVSVQAQGGTAPLTYRWSSPVPSGTGAVATNLSAGTYTVTITDKNDCFIVRSATVSQPNPVIATISPSMPKICIGESIELKANGGTSYLWANGQGNDDEINVSPTVNTTYTVTVTDAATKNCTDQVSVSLIVNPLPTVNITVSEVSNTDIKNDGILCDEDEITLTATGGTSYNWTGGNPNPYKFTPPLGESTYRVTVTDNNGCVSTKSQDVMVNLNPNANFVFNSPTQIVNDPQNISNTSQSLCGELVDCVWEIQENANLNDCDNISPSFGTQGLKDIKLTVENACGCKDEISKVLDIGASDQCAIEEFTLNNSEPAACVGQEVEFIAKARPSGGDCVLSTPRFTVLRNGVEMTNGNQFQFLSNAFIFNEEGDYEVTYTINDGADCGCSKFATRPISILPPPTVSFATDNPTQGCEGEEVVVSFSGYDNNETVTVLFDNGAKQPYQINSFEYTPLSIGLNTLEIINVGIGICNVPVDGETLEIDILPEFKIVSEDETDCTDDLRFSYTVVFEGGDPNVPLSVEGITGGSFLGDNSFTVDNLQPNVPYDFTVSRGDACDAIPISIRKIQCNCTFTVGGNEVSAFSGCEDEVFDISSIFSTEGSEFDPETDTIVYVIHQSGGGVNLGAVFDVLPFSALTLDNNFPGFTAGFEYRISAVGLKKASLEDGDFDFSNPPSLSFMGENDCLSVVNGIPVIWNPIPKPAIATESGENLICRSANDFMIFTRNRVAGSNLEFEVINLDDSNIKKYGFDDRAFIYFEDNGQDSFQVVVTETVIGTNSIECEGKDTLTLYVKDGPGAPPLSNIVLWPGNILASTADSSTTCFEWRFFRPGASDASPIQSTDKYFFAAIDQDLANGTDIYFVDTYFCDNPECVTRVFFNNEGPLPGLVYKEEETFQYQFKPNPNNGRFTLSLFSDMDGSYRIDMYNTAGKKVYSVDQEVLKNENEIEFELESLAKGLYFIQIYDKTNKVYSTDKVVIN